MLSVHVESVEAAFTFWFLSNDEERELLDIYFDVQWGRRWVDGL